MAATDRTPLGAATTARKWWLDVRPADTTGDTGWVGVHGITEGKPKASEPTEQDDSDYDGEGWKSSTVTAMAHGYEGKVVRKTQASAPDAYDPGQELIREAAEKMGVENRIQYRVYEMEPGGPRVQAFQGYASCTWDEDGGSMDALSTASFTLKGQGKREAIAHPDAGAAA